MSELSVITGKGHRQQFGAMVSFITIIPFFSIITVLFRFYLSI